MLAIALLIWVYHFLAKALPFHYFCDFGDNTICSHKL